MEFQKQRLKFGFGRPTRNKLFEELARSNTRIRELLDTSEKNSALKKSREGMKKSLATEMLWGFWRHAKTTYDLLTEAFNCQCKHLHRIQLKLQHQVYITDIQLLIRLLYSSSMEPSPSSWICKETKIEQLFEGNNCSEIQLSVPSIQLGSKASKSDSESSRRSIQDLCGKITATSLKCQEQPHTGNGPGLIEGHSAVLFCGALVTFGGHHVSDMLYLLGTCT